MVYLTYLVNKMERIVEIGTVSSRGQIAIPVDVRNKLNLKDGEKMLFVLEGDTLIIKKVSSHNKTWEEITKPLREAAKKSDLKEENVVDLVHRSRKLNSNQILKIINDHKAEINKYSVKKIGLFGSYVKGKQNEKSDIDILVEFHKSGFDNYMDLKFFLEKIFGKKVDLVIESGLKPELLYIKKEVKYARL
ncbi:MAG: nucleotidyltransferase domain-containing protein [Nanoarchaeota archaeon]